MFELLRAKIKTLNELMWDHRVPWTAVERWLSHFEPDPPTGKSERLHALYLLSHFSLYNSVVMRELLRALYRDLFQYPLLEQIRRRRKHTWDIELLESAYQTGLEETRFLGIGNPSESGTHLLYYFRQENKLPTRLFVHSHELFEGTPAKPRLAPGIKRVVFLDDFCGSGSQAVRYSSKLLPRLKQLRSSLQVFYFPLFATTEGLAKVRSETQFNRVETVCELDESFRSLSTESRYFREAHADIDRVFAETTCRTHGASLNPSAALGFGDCQLLLGFAHNIPNNTLPIFWAAGDQARPWAPVFPRHTKGPGW